jgi:methylmalonyl-CoA/ethylmalonyl-CoA epimerase
MLGRLNHVAIAVPNAVEAGKMYAEKFGATVSEAVPQPDHGVITVFVELTNTKIELLEPLGDDSPIKGFLAKNPKGGIHHLCIEVDDIVAASTTVKQKGITITGTGEPKIGAHGKPVVFLHPKDLHGTLLELEQV